MATPDKPNPSFSTPPSADKDELYIRASGQCICDICGKFYRQHPPETNPEFLDNDGFPFLIRLCDGGLVKL